MGLELTTDRLSTDHESRRATSSATTCLDLSNQYGLGECEEVMSVCGFISNHNPSAFALQIVYKILYLHNFPALSVQALEELVSVAPLLALQHSSLQTSASPQSHCSPSSTILLPQNGPLSVIHT